MHVCICALWVRLNILGWWGVGSYIYVRGWTDIPAAPPRARGRSPPWPRTLFNVVLGVWLGLFSSVREEGG